MEEIELQLKENQTLYVEVRRLVAKRSNKIALSEYRMFYEDLYKLLLVMYDESDKSKDPEKTKSWVARELVGFLIPQLEWFMDRPISDEDLTMAYRTWDKSMALASRRSFHHFLLYMEMDRQPDRQIYSNRLDILGGIVYYLNKMHVEPQFMDLVGSFPPSFGKSFVGNYFTAWVLGNDYNGSVLRMSYSDDLLNGFSRSVKSLLTEDRFKAIFPYFDKFSNKIFEKEKDSDWLIKGADTLVSHYTRTRDGAVTGIRAKSYIMFDDMTKGAEEAYNDGLHETYWSKYMSEWRNRKNDYKVKEITLGTMWNPNDILSRKGNQLEGKYTPHKGNHPYCTEYHDEEGQVMGVVIRYPLLDENEKSTCELIYSTKDALDIKANTEEFLFSCVYQQDPISQKGRLFSYDEIMTYEFNGNKIFHNGKNITLSDGSFASLDPVRKGKDFVAMPIFKYDIENPHIYYLIDVLFKGKSMEEVYGEIIGNVTQHKIIKFVIENNTDVSLKSYLEKELKQRGYYSCEMMEKFNTVKKEQRIRDENLPMRKQIVYPQKGLFTANSDMGKFMDNITRFSLEQPNKHDDAPDSVALFVNQIIKDGYKGAKVEAIRRPTGF